MQHALDRKQPPNRNGLRPETSAAPPIQGKLAATIVCSTRIVAATTAVAKCGHRRATWAATPGPIAALAAKPVLPASIIRRRLVHQRLARTPMNAGDSVAGTVSPAATRNTGTAGR